MGFARENRLRLSNSSKLDCIRLALSLSANKYKTIITIQQIWNNRNVMVILTTSIASM